MTSSADTTVVIADGKTRLATLLAELLGDEPGFAVVAVADAAEAALVAARTHRPDVVVVGEQLLDTSGEQLCARLREAVPEATLLLWSGRAPAPADLLLERDATFRDLVRCLRRRRRVIDLDRPAGSPPERLSPSRHHAG